MTAQRIRKALNLAAWGLSPLPCSIPASFVVKYTFARIEAANKYLCTPEHHKSVRSYHHSRTQMGEEHTSRRSLAAMDRFFLAIVIFALAALIRALTLAVLTVL